MGAGQSTDGAAPKPATSSSGGVMGMFGMGSPAAGTTPPPSNEPPAQQAGGKRRKSKGKKVTGGKKRKTRAKGKNKK